MMELPTVVKGRAQDRGSRAVSCVTLEARNSHSVAFVSSFKWARKHVTGGYEDGKEEGWGGVSCTRQHTNILQVCTGWVKPAKGPVPWRSGGMALATRQEQLFKKKKKESSFLHNVPLGPMCQVPQTLSFHTPGLSLSFRVIGPLRQNAQAALGTQILGRSQGRLPRGGSSNLALGGCPGGQGVKGRLHRWGNSMCKGSGGTGWW